MSLGQLVAELPAQVWKPCLPCLAIKAQGFACYFKSMDSGLFTKALDALRRCREEGGSLVVLTGAGVSKESGIPTFRDAQTGLWENFRPEDLATREGFLKNPKLVWDWYDFRRNGVWNAQPNPGHVALVEMEAAFPHF